MSPRSENRQTWPDPLTGLEWQLDSPGEMSWYEAFEYAGSLSLDHHQDWRFPSLRELESLLDRSRYRPVMREAVPFRDHLSYWSSTTFGENTQNAWIIMFDGAYVLSYYKTNAYQVRCVRGMINSREIASINRRIK
ncbi:MAG: hypothetical protein A2277_18225 [Desulfobacterales bacterium RIFOXYA12_FULL_46_15]|nr:MAG: hypothetical protein A2277_18225 [Desulfobacterales bacterium RIFOXYA12_FULL_46_15]